MKLLDRALRLLDQAKEWLENAESGEILVALVLLMTVIIVIHKTASPKSKKGRFTRIADKFKSLSDVTDALREAGLESSNLLIGIDYTKSNEWTGKRSFAGRCLHHIDGSGRMLNPYQRVIRIIGETLASFDDDGEIPVFGFGDVTTGDRAVFSVNPARQDGVCFGLDDVLSKYTLVTPSVRLAGPTSFAPLIRRAVEIVRESAQYHVLLIVADGQVTNPKETADAIVEASNFPLSIVMVGVGDGPWDTMETFDDELPARRFDNFQFVNFHQVMQQAQRKHGKRSELSLGERQKRDFAVAALQELPDQYLAIRQLDLMN
ncbi:MAG: hypothetical protein MHM6MM_003457 [Cercozoa sp. M6MM]